MTTDTGDSGKAEIGAVLGGVNEDGVEAEAAEVVKIGISNGGGSGGGEGGSGGESDIHDQLPHDCEFFFFNATHTILFCATKLIPIQNRHSVPAH